MIERTKIRMTMSLSRLRRSTVEGRWLRLWNIALLASLPSSLGTTLTRQVLGHCIVILNRHPGWREGFGKEAEKSQMVAWGNCLVGFILLSGAYCLRCKTSNAHGVIIQVGNQLQAWTAGCCAKREKTNQEVSQFSSYLFIYGLSFVIVTDWLTDVTGYHINVTHISTNIFPPAPSSPF